MTEPSYATVENRLAAMQTYIDRLYKTISWHGKTCGLLMNNPGMPVWTEIKRTIYSQPSTVKAKSLWNGSGNDAPPNGWETVYYDGSPWAWATQAATEHAPPTGSTCLWSSQYPVAASQQCLFRHYFYVPWNELISAILYFRADDQADIYINGTLVLQDTEGGTPGYIGPEQSVDIKPYIKPWIISQPGNVLAVRGINVMQTKAWAAWRIEMVCRAALGQWFGETKGDLVPHSVIPGQLVWPAWGVDWLAPDNLGQTSDNFNFGLESGDTDTAFQGPPANAVREYNTVNSQVTYKVEHIEKDYAVPATDVLDIYIGGTKVVSDLKVQNKDTWVSSTITKSSVGSQDYLTCLNYPPRHGFHLGKMFYSARGDTAKVGYFQNSIDESGFIQDIYDVMYGDLAESYPWYYQFWSDVYKDAFLAWKGDKMTDLPVGIASDGQYVYPYQSKVTPQWGILPGWWFYSLYTRAVSYVRMLWALKMLRHGPADKKWPDPLIGGTIPIESPLTSSTSPLDVADQAIAEWTDNQGLGMPPATSALTRQAGRGSASITAVFCHLMSVLGHGLGYEKYKAYADNAASVLCGVVWGVASNGDITDKGYWDGIEYTRPNHTGGTLRVWKAGGTPNDPKQATNKDELAQFIDETATQGYDLGTGIVWISPAFGYKPEEPSSPPTGMEGTVLAYLALRAYNAFKHNRAYPVGTWSSGLSLGGVAAGFVSGKVTAGGSPVTGATVMLVDGAQVGNPADLPGYIDLVATDTQGSWSFRYRGTGNKTIYVYKSGYKHTYKTYNFTASDQNIVFPDVALEAL